MTWRAVRAASCALCAAAALLACGSVPQSGGAAAAPVPASAMDTWSRQYAALAASGGTLLHLDPQRSSVRILVFRGGRAARLGHNHVATATAFGGFLYLPGNGAAGARFDLEFRLDALQLDAPDLRASLGAPFAAELTPGDIANTRSHMLGDDNLQADRYPFVRIRGLQVSGEGPDYAVDVECEMHGRKQTLRVPVRVEGLPERAAVSGSLVLRQSDFGVQPYSALGGLIAVQDAVIVQFTLVAN
jgi:hypothetical protein